MFGFTLYGKAVSYTLESNSLLEDLRLLARRADTTVGLGYSSPATLQTRAQQPSLLCRWWASATTKWW